MSDLTSNKMNEIIIFASAESKYAAKITASINAGVVKVASVGPASPTIGWSWAFTKEEAIRLLESVCGPAGKLIAPMVVKHKSNLLMLTISPSRFVLQTIIGDDFCVVANVTNEGVEEESLIK